MRYGPTAARGGLVLALLLISGCAANTGETAGQYLPVSG